MAFINIGFGNMIQADDILVMITPDSAPAKRLIQSARDHDALVDATQGRKTRGVLVSRRHTVVLSALQPDTIAARANEAAQPQNGRGGDT